MFQLLDCDVPSLPCPRRRARQRHGIGNVGPPPPLTLSLSPSFLWRRDSGRLHRTKSTRYPRQLQWPTGPRTNRGEQKSMKRKRKGQRKREKSLNIMKEDLWTTESAEQQERKPPCQALDCLAGVHATFGDMCARVAKREFWGDRQHLIRWSCTKRSNYFGLQLKQAVLQTHCTRTIVGSEMECLRRTVQKMGDTMDGKIAHCSMR